MNQRRLLGIVLCAIVATGGLHAGDDWLQWGGPDRDFTVAGRALSHDWGDDGPPVLWERPLGGGFASIVSDGRRLYVAYREGDDELVAALDRKSGKEQWVHRYAAPVPKVNSLSTEYGRGPNATPLLVDGTIVTLGFTGHLRSLDAKTGKLRWAYDLGEALGVGTPYFGHSASPLAVGKTVVVVAGGVHAFDVATGQLAWSNTELGGNYGSPLLLTAGGRRQIVAPADGRLAGFDAETGKTVWSQEHKNQWGTILTSPIVDESGRVFISAAQVGSMLVDPASDDGRVLWKEATTQINHSNAVRSGKWVFGSVGESASFMSATSIEDGTQAWKARGFAQANLVQVGDTYVLLDFDGELALVELGADGMNILAQASINDEPTWTPPTLIGTTLYVRDESRIQALDLAPSGEPR